MCANLSANEDISDSGSDSSDFTDSGSDFTDSGSALSDNDSDFSVDPNLWLCFFELNKLIMKGDKTAVLNYIDCKAITPESYSVLSSKMRTDLDPVRFAADNGQIDIMNELISQRFSLDASGRPLINLACLAGDVPVVKSLVEVHEVDVMAADGCGDTPLYCAVNRNRQDVVKYLLEAGASVNETYNNNDGENVSLLHSVTNARIPDMCEYLLSQGANVDARDDDGETPLFMAARLDSEEISRILLNAGADVNVVNENGLTPFYLAVSFCSSLNTLRLLYSRGADAERRFWDGSTLLHTTVQNRFYPLDRTYQVARFLVVEVNVCLDSKNDDGHTPFSLAVLHGRSDLLDLLFHAGCTVVQAPPGGWSIDEKMSKLGSAGQDEFLKELDHLLSRPRSLMQLCTFTIRRVLGKTIGVGIEALPLPQTLKNAVRLEHLPHPVHKLRQQRAM